jgi:hypothetical protein
MSTVNMARRKTEEITMADEVAQEMARMVYENVQAIRTSLTDPATGEMIQVAARFDAVDARLDGMDARFDGMDARFDGMDARLGAIESSLTDPETGQLVQVAASLKSMEAKQTRILAILELMRP